MNLDDKLRRDAERSRRMDGPNPLTGRVEEISSRVRRRRRGRAAAGTIAVVAAVGAGVWGVGQSGLLDWQAPPPASPSETSATSETSSPTPTPEQTETPSEAPSDDATPSGPLDPAPEFVPACGDAWSPPDLNTGLAIDADWGSGPFTASPDGATGGIDADAVITNVSSEAVSHGTYTWTILVQDGTVVSPQGLGSDAVGDIDLQPEETTTFAAGHQLWDHCEDGWNGVGPSVPAGTYTVYTMLMDLDAYQESGTRNVLAISDGVDIDVVG